MPDRLIHTNFYRWRERDYFIVFLGKNNKVTI